MVWKMGPRSRRSILMDRQMHSQEPHEIAHRKKKFGKRKRGLAAAPLATRRRVARMGGRARRSR